MLSDIGAIIVTFNRLEKLKKALDSYETQTLLPKYIIVVDNASKDGTKEYLENWKKENSEYEKIVVSLSENKGGAGGFYEGQKLAITKDANWIVLGDDDLYFDKNYLFEIGKFINDKGNKDICSIVCGTVIENNKIALPHRRILKSKWRLPFTRNIEEQEYKKDLVYLDFVSYCGPVLNKEKLIKAGLVRPDYFIHNDDIEHSYRMRNVGKIVCLPKIFAKHDTESSRVNLDWKIYYYHRNEIDFIKRHFKIQLPYFVVISLVLALLRSLKRRNFKEFIVKLVAIKDGLFGNMGKHPIYMPGWKYNK